MKLEENSQRLLSTTRAKAKMYEYDVRDEFHIQLPQSPDELFVVATCLLGDIAASINSAVRNFNSLDASRENVRFAATFFDSFIGTKLNKALDPYLLVLGSSAYYFANLPGSSSVLISNLDSEELDLNCGGLERLIVWLLNGDFNQRLSLKRDSSYLTEIEDVVDCVRAFFSGTELTKDLSAASERIRRSAYDFGSARELLLADIASALVKSRVNNSSRMRLPNYSEIPLARWEVTLKKPSFVRELWPAQHLLGKHGVFRGKSAVVQMPTSAGKTKALEIIIRSSFLSGRTSNAIIVSPYRALSHEIRDSLTAAFHDESVEINELSDVIQADFLDLWAIDDSQRVIIVTPEKLVYVLRQDPSLSSKVGLLIYDEGHMFDAGRRGVTYELLLTSLKSLVPSSAQVVLISAVITNAESINGWLNNGTGAVVSGGELVPTERTVAFASWRDSLGRLEFVAKDNPEKEEFYVPRVLQSQELRNFARETATRNFPDKKNTNSIALYLGLKLVKNGGVAIFCGRKDSATKLCETAIDALERGLESTLPIDFSDKREISLLTYLFETNLGPTAAATQAARIGLLTHHGSIPQGLRLAVEHAMKKGLAKFVICTSTLAQGVNLPIRYLVMTGLRQAESRISVRDFHNLMGRAGRSGMHTEGTILFSDPDIYDTRYMRRENWRWWQAKELLDPSNSEPCASSLLTLFPSQEVSSAAALPEDEITEIKAAIESYLMSQNNEENNSIKIEEVTNLARSTLAYYLSNDETRQKIISLFLELSNQINEKVPDVTKRKLYGRTLFGINTCLEIEKGVVDCIQQIEEAENPEQLLQILWPILSSYNRNSSFNSCNQSPALFEVALLWISGQTFHKMFEKLSDLDVRFGKGRGARKSRVEHAVELGENAFSFESALVMGAVIEIVGMIRPENFTLITNLKVLQKRLKYGLASPSAVTIFELGFPDRIIASELDRIVTSVENKKKSIKNDLINKKDLVLSILSKYPSYFSISFNLLCGETDQ
jgi:POLQ-like helicase